MQRDTPKYFFDELENEEAFTSRQTVAHDNLLKLFLILSLQRLPVPDNFMDLPSEERIKIVNAAKNHKFDQLQALRQEAYFISLKEKHAAGEKLTPTEYLYFAMTTDNINQIDPDILIASNEQHHFQNFSHHVSTLYHLLKYQHESVPAKRKGYFHVLRQLLNDRHQADNNSNSLILNLHGANFEGLDVRDLNFNDTDLGHANFTKAKIADTYFQNANLDYANFTEADCNLIKTGTGYKQGAPNFARARARHATFDGMYANNFDWYFADFTGSSFRRANLMQGIYEHAVFDDTDFSDGILEFSNRRSSINCSLKRANFVTGKLFNAHYNMIDGEQIKLITEGAFVNSEILKDELDRLDGTVMKYGIRAHKGSPAYQESQINSFQKLIAKLVIDGIHATTQSAENKRDLINIALERNLFQPDSSYKPAANSFYRSTFGLFSHFTDDYQHHELFATPAIDMLQVERNRYQKEALPRVEARM